jgi:hypothetical protein
MSGMGKKGDERVGKRDTEVKNPPAEATYMRDWWLTWWPVCDTELRNATTQLQARQNICHGFPIVEELPRTNNPATSTVLGHAEGVLYAIPVVANCTNRISTEDDTSVFGIELWRLSDTDCRPGASFDELS